MKKNWKTFLNQEITFRRKKFTDKKKQQLYNDLSTLLSSGINIINAFELLKESFSKSKDKVFIDSIIELIIEGASLSEAFEKTGKFSAYEFYSIKIGEETGQVNKVLSDLNIYFKKKIDQKRKIIGAFMYPAIVILTALMAVFFMMNFVVPMFEEIYKRFDSGIPALTKIVINISHALSEIIIIMVIISIIIIVFYYIVRDKLWFREYKNSLLLKLPLLGELIRKTYLLRFCLSMELLTGSDIALINSITLVKKMISFYPLQNSLNGIYNDLLYGMPLNESMKKFKIFDNRMTSLIKVAEETNKFENTFSILRNQYQSDIDYKSSIISSVMEPLLIIMIGIVVAVILISMYLPIFKISSEFNF